MDIAIIILAALAFAHFIYEGIIAPSLRMKLRNRMFDLRDKLRHLHINNDRCSRDAFDVAHTGINQYINRLHGVTIGLMVDFKEAYRDSKFREEVERRKKILDACESPELKSICSEANQNIESALMINTVMLFLYVIPLAIAAFCISTVTAKIHRFSVRLLATPEARTDKLVPESVRFA
jgi:hypothetical protein